MADYAGDNVAYWISVPTRCAPALYPLRAWPNLKMATAEGLLWLRGFSEAEIASVSVLRIPMIARYYLKEARLYPIGKSLPAMVAPTLLWTDLRRGLKVRLPQENFNYFGVAQTHGIELVASQTQREITATIVDWSALGRYLHAAPQVRTASLRWTILAAKRALIIGTPLLPIQGLDYYRQACFLIPAGWQLEYESMAATYQEALGDSHAYWYLFDQHHNLSKLSKANFNHLSKGSFATTSLRP